MTTPLELLPVSAVAYVLGLCMARKQKPETAAQIAALTAELKRRGVWPDLLAALDPDLARQLQLMEGMARGQAWSRGRRTPGV